MNAAKLSIARFPRLLEICDGIRNIGGAGM